MENKCSKCGSSFVTICKTDTGVYEHCSICGYDSAPMPVPHFKHIDVRECNNILKGIKNDSDKIDWSLLPYPAIEDMLKVFMFGAKKYERNNYRLGFKQTRLIAAAYRHLGEHAKGNDIDEESGLPHLAHLICCASMLLTNIKEGKDDDDRYKIPTD